ncbi:MAG: hypothetical protein JWP34_4563 [Massilia sp.]|nr:hypothetical protein [Gemmatimonadales bacterium]MDB5910449.1 hypothetical protein [Massilia sp.]
MGGVGGILTGALALAALQTIVASDRASSGLATLVQVPGSWARTFMDPKKPLLPNFSKAPCAEKGDLSLFSFLTAASQTSSPATIAPIPNMPNPSSLPPPQILQA